ncbi:MAG: glycosyltransferase family 2 protein [Acidimicrobiaceae bacterium]|nr:glycosyltransferase family 2 protein [Acidimicrobiaceae bacterium]
MQKLQLFVLHEGGDTSSSECLLRPLPNLSEDACSGDIVAWLTGDAKLHPGFHVAVFEAFKQYPQAVALYTDIAIEGRRIARPAWSPTRVQSAPGSSLPLVVRVRVLVDVGLLPADDGASLLSADAQFKVEAYLASTEMLVLHIPSVLISYPTSFTHPREQLSGKVQSANTFRPPPQPIRSVQELLVRECQPGNTLRPRPRHRSPCLRNQRRTSVVIPSAGVSLPGSETPLLENALNSLALLDPLPQEVIVVVGDEYAAEVNISENMDSSMGSIVMFADVADNLGVSVDSSLLDRVFVLYRGPGAFNFSFAINQGILAGKGEFVLLLNDDMEANTPDWLGRMAAHLRVPSVGAVGATLLYPNRTIQHIGIVIDDARPLHPFIGQRLEDVASHNGDVARDVISVTAACLLARRRDLMTVGGMSEMFPLSFGDVDLCLKLRRLGLRVIVEPAAQLTHFESISREPHIRKQEWDRYIHRWGEVIDPWYHPAFHRPDDLECLRLNVDHLDPVNQNGRWPVRNAMIRSQVHRSRVGSV